MNESMQERLNAVLKEHLPSQVGDALQEELKELGVLRKLNKELNLSLGSLGRAQVDMQAEVAALNTKLAAYGDITTRTAAVHTRELKQDLREAEVKFAELRRQDAFAMVQLVFKSPVYKEHIHGQVPVPLQGYPASGSSYSNQVNPSVGSGLIDKTTRRSEE